MHRTAVPEIMPARLLAVESVLQAAGGSGVRVLLGPEAGWRR